MDNWKPHPLRLWRASHGLVASDVAPALGINLSSLSMLENWKHEPRLGLALRIQQLTQGEVQVDSLLVDPADGVAQASLESLLKAKREAWPAILAARIERARKGARVKRRMRQSKA